MCVCVSAASGGVCVSAASGGVFLSEHSTPLRCLFSCDKAQCCNAIRENNTFNNSRLETVREVGMEVEGLGEGRGGVGILK